MKSRDCETSVVSRPNTTHVKRIESCYQNGTETPYICNESWGIYLKFKIDRR